MRPLAPVCSLLAVRQVSFSVNARSGQAVLSPTPRPNLVRRETDQILSYYQSEHAGRSFDYATAAGAADNAQHSSPAPHVRKGSAFSSESDYSSHYSSESVTSDSPSATTPVRATTTKSQPEGTRTHNPVARHSRRPSVPTEGGADRRRLAIVEMDEPAPLSVGRKRSRGLKDKSSQDFTHTPSSSMSGSTLFSRRGVHIGGLALVAPPDASPRTYTNLTPPSSAPVAADRTSHPPPSASSHYHHHAHARSASEAAQSSNSHSQYHSHSHSQSQSQYSRLHHKSSRDVGIVGLSSASTASESAGPASPTSDDYHMYAQHGGLGVPLFQTPAKSRSPSPGGTTPDLSDTSSASAYHRSPGQHLLSTPIFGMEDGIVTPGIGEFKDIQQPVVGPVIVGLSPELMARTQQPPDASAAAQQHASVRSPQSPTSTSPSYQSSSSSSYLHYQPGIHATAGPLPPPPRSIFDASTGPPPRPPRFHTPVPSSNRRDIEAIKEKLQLPQSVSAVLAARTPPEANKRLGHDRSPSRSDTKDSVESTYSQDNDFSVKLVPNNSVHRREGAFPPSTIFSSPPNQSLVQSPLSSEPSTSLHAEGLSRPVVVVEDERDREEDEEDAASRTHESAEPERRPGLELRRESSWVSLRQEAAEASSSPNGRSAVLPNVSASLSRSTSSGHSSTSSLPVPPPKSVHSGSDDEKHASLAPSSFRATLTNLKRFSSLPRTPSRSSRSTRSTSPDPRRSFSPPPMPPPHSVSLQIELPRRRVMPRPTKVSPWPRAMDSKDVTILRSARERARAYADKINDLATYDCGLREWLATQERSGHHPRQHSHRTVQRLLHTALPPELGGMTPQTRHVSHGSLASQATFPIRADAYTATDLSVRPIDIAQAPTTAPPPTLPYPALAQASATRAHARNSTLLSSPTKSLAMLPGTKGAGTGFFASLGRKTSVRREKGLSSLGPQSANNKLLTKRPPGMAQSRSNPQPSTSARDRDIPLPSVPAIPGGPRAAPGRIQRAKTYSVAPSQPQPQPVPVEPARTSTQRQSAVGRRPSLFARARPNHASTTVGPAAPSVVDPAFQQQVEKLAAILPHADRAILAGYLRRSGEDILAIGQYLEDEKNGTLRRD
ncbi:hypothetical protein BD413DRAFT_475757 [Trametes elegans]|nr:hypothetical protein BD413DRAFT_475757 [Trametes elegans]